jgi:tetratricopeptide (TPR) repeat protein
MVTIIERRSREPEVSLDSLQASVRKEVLLLEDIGRQPDKKAAAGALAALGWVQLSALNDASGARASVREAVADDPTVDPAWDILVALSLGEGSADELVEICESRLQHLDSTRNRLYLAKAYLRRDKPEKADEQAGAILKVEPNNLAAWLVLAVADLKRSDNPQFLQAAGVALNQAMQISKVTPQSAESSDRHREISLNLAIWAGLQDDPEYRKLAKTVVQEVLEHLPDDQTARDILRALQ